MKRLVWMTMAILTASGAWALDIPLDGGGGAGTALNIGYVDMERIYQLYPKTLNAKEDYAKQLSAKKSELSKKEAELISIKNRLNVLEATLKAGTGDAPADVTPSSGSADDSEIDPSLENLQAKDPESLTALRKELEIKKADFEEQQKRAQGDLIAFERKQNQTILGTIYQALQDLAQEEQLTIVVDKTSILYGDANIDLTEKLQAKVRGY